MNTEHLQQCADAGALGALPFMCGSQLELWDAMPTFNDHNNARLAFAQAAISTYLKLNPVWVKASERMPTMDDADDCGAVGLSLIHI